MTEANAKKLQELEQEYAKQCLKLGELEYRKRALEMQAGDVLKTIEGIQREAFFIKREA